MNLVQLFKGLSDPVRLRIAHLLCQRGELCVCHLTEALALPQSTVSRHLNTLKSCGLVEAERRGQWVYYQMRLSNDQVAAVAEMIRAGAVEQQLQKDLANLKEGAC